ncbi:MAG: response regulator [Defluviitaleaceae bacterium]|nr:response regulator [Defluviitaleaceae bacterium]
MKRVLIVDDEYLVRLGLKSIINWNVYGYQIVAETHNGQEALALIDEIQPDILITDIKMQVMDGITLLEEIRKQKKDIVLVILTNYDEFGFARKAMSLGVTHYLLKSELSEASLVEVLRNISIDLSSKPKRTDIMWEARHQYLQGQLFGFPPNESISADRLEAPPAGLFTHSEYVAIKCGCIMNMQADDVEPMDKPMQTLQSIVISSLTLPDATYCTSMYQGAVYLSVIGSVSCTTMERLAEQCALIVRNSKNYLDVSIRMGVSEFLSAPLLPILLSQAEAARSDGFFSERSVTFFRDITVPCGTDRINVSHSKIKRLLYRGERQSLTAYIHQIFSELRELHSYAALQSVFVDFISCAKSVCEEASLRQTAGLSQDKFDYAVLSKMHSLDRVCHYIIEFYATIFDVMSNRGNYHSPTIAKCLHYISKHYEKSITLEDAAKAANITPSYLSMAFKQEMGISFVQYLTQIRIAKSEALLLDTNMKIYEIAEKVGFPSPYYFSKVFKEQKGITCKEYREKHTLSAAQAE